MSRTVEPAASAGQVALVVPDTVSPSGGNTYNHAVAQALTAAGWAVRELPVRGAWPRPTTADRNGLARALAALPDGSVALLDGLVACPVPDVVAAQARRLRLAVLVHLPLADETGLAAEDAARLDGRERQALRAAAAVVATSEWAAARLVERHRLPAGRVHVAAPGVAPAPLAPGSDGASQLLCVAALTPRKGQDLLVEALAQVADLRWRCQLVGDTSRAPDFTERVRRLCHDHGLAGRITLAGPRTGEALATAYAGADLLVLASHAETYGMVVTEALARGLPVLATAVGGVPEALGRGPGGARPGLLVPPAQPVALADALRRWLTQPATRDRLRAAARERRGALTGWPDTAARLAAVLGTLTATPAGTGAEHVR